MSTFVKFVKVVFVTLVASVVLSACGGGNNVLETLRNAAQENFLPDEGATVNVDGKPMTRPEAAAFWAMEVGKLQVCESGSMVKDVVYIKIIDNGAQFAFSNLANNDKPECTMVRPWSPVLNGLIKSGAYSTNLEVGQAAIASR
jgi:hypothetical protein